MISLILPVYNEEHLLRRNLPVLIKEMNAIQKTKNNSYEIIIVEESTDNTPMVAKEFAKLMNIRHIHNNERLGKGGAVEKGILHSRGDKIVFMDIDLSANISSLSGMIEKLDEYDIVVGSRFHPESVVDRPFYRSFLGFGFSLLTNILLKMPVKDTQCGFKGFRKKPIKNIIRFVRNKEWFWDIEVLYYAKKLHYRIHEIPITWKYKGQANYNVFSHILCHSKNVIKLFLNPLM